MNKFWKLQNAVDGTSTELILEGPISSESWWGDEVTPQAFRDELKNHTGNQLLVVLNSPGGDVFAGLSIYNALRELNATVTVRVDGLAASIASIVAMAGDEVIMSPGSMMMIHKPYLATVGNSDELKKAQEMLDNIEESLIPIYAAKSGQSVERIAEMLKDETWLTPEKAVELGFADKIAGESTMADTVQNILTGKLAFSMQATEEAMKSYVEKVAAQNEVTEDVTVEEEVVTEPETVETEVTEIVTTDTEENKVTEETTTMTENEVVAQAQVVEPQALAPVVPSVKDYVSSKEAMTDFANILAKNAGAKAEEVKAAWADHLATKMGITNPEVLLPSAVIQAIEDAFAEGGEIWNIVNKTGLDVFTAAVDTVTGETSRAKGHVRGGTKGEEVITLGTRTIRAQFIYKYLTLNKEDIRENRSTGALLRYVLTELPRRIVREVERAIVIGDGRSGSSEYKVTSFKSLKADAASSDGYAVTYTPVAGEARYETILRAKALAKAEGAKYLIAKPGYLTDLLLEQGVNGGYVFAPGTDVARAMGFAGVIEPDWFDDTSDAANDAYILVASQYKTVGDSSIESFTNFALSTNKQEYLQEIYAGGALTALNSAVAIVKTPVAS